MRRITNQSGRLMSQLFAAFPNMVPEADLIAAVWPDLRPRKPKNALRSLIHDLRQDGLNIVNTFDKGYAVALPKRKP